MQASGNLIVLPSGEIPFPKNTLVVAFNPFLSALVDRLGLLRQRRITMKYSRPTCWLPCFHTNVRTCRFLFRIGLLIPVVWLLRDDVGDGFNALLERFISLSHSSRSKVIFPASSTLSEF